MKKTELQKMVTMMVEQAKVFDIVDELIAGLQSIESENNNAPKTVKNATPTATPADTNSKSKSKSDSKSDSKSKSEPKSEPKSAPKKEYGLPVFKSDSKFVTYTNADGSYLKHKGIRQVLNTRIKELGGTWNGEVRAWEFSSVAKAKACVKNIDRVVTSEQLDTVVDAWNNHAQAKAERKSTRK